ncbi:gp53-like domain-containing protein, partial [Burkholderia sp. AW33-5]
GSGTQTFDVANPTFIGTQAINGRFADARYAQIAGSSSQVFSAGWSGAGTAQVVPRNQADALYAGLAGNASQAFNVAQGTSNNQAVRLDQFQGALTTNGWVSFPNTSGIYRTIVIQWGVIVAPANSNNSYSLATTFANGAFSCVASRFAGGSNASVNANPVGKSQIQIQNYGSSSESVGYLIIGN